MAKNQIKTELDSLAGETLAFAAILGFVLQRLGSTDPRLATAIANGFDEAANFVEHFAIRTGTAAAAGHTVKAIQGVEEIRAAAVGGKSQPKHGV
jgi:hypothetical protein